MLNRFQTLIAEKYNSFQGKNVYLAISGGKDSMCLSHLLLAANIPHHLLHCNFKLRGSDADEDEKFIQSYAEKHQLPVNTKQFDTTVYANKKGLTIQEAARNLRYDWFATFMQTESDILLTAHHRDDSIETFFINLLRGTSIHGLTGIQTENQNIIRPLLTFSQKEIVDYIEENQIQFRQDDSNFENKYLRNDIRHNILPLFEAHAPTFGQKMHDTMASIRATTDWIKTNAHEFRNRHFKADQRGRIIVDKEVLIKQADIFKEHLLAPYGIHRAKITAFNQFLNGITGAQFETETHQFSINRGQLIIDQKHDAAPFSPVLINELPIFVDGPTGRIEMAEKQISPDLKFSDNPQYLAHELLEFPLKLRKWEQGDRIKPLGMKGSKLISDLLIDKKIPLIDKENILVLCQSNTVLAVIGICIHHDFRAVANTQKLLSIAVKN